MQTMEIINKEEEPGVREEKQKYLPSDIIFDILTWVPSQDIEVCRWVSKSWKSITYEPNFKHMHCQRTETISGFILQNMVRCHYKSTFASLHQSPNHPKLSLDFLPEDVKIMASSSHGLLCCVSQVVQDKRRPASSSWRIPRYYICKPATKEWRKLPNPKTRYFTENFAMAVLSTKPLQYKLLRLSRPLHTMRYLNCEMFSSSSWSWKQLQNVYVPDTYVPYQDTYICEQTILLPNPGLFIRRAFHWLTTADFIFSFDIDSEKWFTIPLPNDHEVKNIDGLHRARARIVEYGDKLGLVYYNDDWCRYWVMEDIKKMRWELKRHAILAGSLEKISPHFIFRDIYTIETLLFQWASSLIWYNVQTKKAATTKIKDVQPIDTMAFESNVVLSLL
ncbi:hypothetical protein ACLOJK_033795 [Asimina triloba]